MTAHETLAAAIECGVFLYVEDGHLKYRIRMGALPAELKRGLREHREEIVRRLSHVQAAAADAEHVVPPPLQKRASGGRVPLSYAQQRLWFIDRLGEGSFQYHVKAAYRLTGPLDLDALTRALWTIVDRHESLRTVILEEDGRPYQVVLQRFGVPLVTKDLSALTPEQQDREIRRSTAPEARSAFDLSRDLMLRAELFILSAESHVLRFETHHIATDASSQAILGQELTALYTAYREGRPDPLPPVHIQYADYTVWQRSWLQGDVLARQLGFWQRALQGIPDVHGLVLDRERPAKPTHAGAAVQSHIGPETLEQIRALCRRHDVTLFMFLQTAVSVLLARYSNDPDVVMGMPVAGRVHPDLEAVIGLFVNTLVLRTKLEGNPRFDEVLARNKQYLLDAMAHQHVPFEMIVEALRPKRTANYGPVFQILINMQPNTADDLALPGLTLQSVAGGSQTSKFDLVFNITESPDHLSIDLVYSSEIFMRATIARMSANLGVLLQSILATPDAGIRDLELLTAEERHRLLQSLNDGCDPPVYLLDDEGRLVPEGAPGELCVGDDPVVARTRRTGKIARWSSSGEIELLGWLDDRITVGNRQIDIARFRAVLAEAPSITGFAILVRRDAAGRDVLVAYVTVDGTPGPASAPRLDNLRDALAAALAPEDLPFALVPVDRIPAPMDGESLESLPIPDAPAAAFRGPATETERRMERVWRTVLPDAPIDIGANFFAMGGHSLSMIVLMKRIATEFGVDIPLAMFIERPTIEAASRFVDQGRASPISDVIPAAAALPEQARPIPQTPIRPLSDAERARPLPVSYVQGSVFLTSLLPAKRIFYNIPGALRMTGPLCRESLRRAFETIVARHAILRTVYRKENDEVVQIIRPAEAFPLPLVNVSRLTADEQQRCLQEHMRVDAERPFDLETELPLRATLIQFSEQHHALLFNMHHVATDGWSYSVLKRELSLLYAAYRQRRNAALPPLQVQYCDYAVWQRGPYTNEILPEEVKYWTDRMRGIPEVHGLPLDRPRPAEPSHRGGFHTSMIDAARVRQLEDLSRSCNGTLFAALHALFVLLIHRYSGDTDIVVGVPLVNRPYSEVQPLIGCFTNTIVLRSNLAGNPRFSDFLAVTAESALHGFAYQGTPFGRVAKVLYPDHPPGRGLYQVMFSFQSDAEAVPFELPDVKVEPIGSGSTLAQRDLTLRTKQTSDGVRIVWEYATDIFNADTIADMASSYATLIESAIRSPEERVDRLRLRIDE